MKNLLAIASGLTRITSRSTKNTEEMANELTLRLTALGHAHNLVRPVPGQTTAPCALLGDLLSVHLAPYDDPTERNGSANSYSSTQHFEPSRRGAIAPKAVVFRLSDRIFTGHRLAGLVQPFSKDHA
ncbi:MAG: HWE histidine kinase domain-containing protein [Sphingorhabdus sp.]